MFMVLFLVVASIVTIYMVISADNETFIMEKKEFVFNFVDKIKDGMSLKDVEAVISETDGIDNPILDSFNFSEGKYNYSSSFNFVDGFAVYAGLIKYYFVYDKLVKVEVIKK